MRDSLIQTDPLSAALSQKPQKTRQLPTISRTPLLLQFTPFGPPLVPSCRKKKRRVRGYFQQFPVSIPPRCSKTSTDDTHPNITDQHHHPRPPPPSPTTTTTITNTNTPQLPPITYGAKRLRLVAASNSTAAIAHTMSPRALKVYDLHVASYFFTAFELSILVRASQPEKSVLLLLE
ncbi:unnamed protein product [Nippostrongylus brasiliensis]|uniref:Uncharacterized protein n=1 Tax=Nippostrongylus brasiliensis TaxID=27835 RepID=A0A0N4XV29_NIPBR|nr:unnamed protein product [Nippostrongylus brasiliensis]